MYHSVAELEAGQAAMDVECMAAAAAKAVRARNHVIHLEQHVEGRDWYERHVGAAAERTCVPTHYGERVSDVEAALRTWQRYPAAEVVVRRRALGGVELTLFPLI